LSDGGYVEDPTVTMEGMAAVRRELLDAGIDTPLASNVAVTSFADLPEAVKTGAAQIVLSDPHYWGGLRETQHLGKLCRSFRLGLSMHPFQQQSHVDILHGAVYCHVECLQVVTGSVRRFFRARWT
jgi:L-alanine-DL-glutamate epimerase-like enolase superfamily enzyme